jgi:hypothetical protein
LETLRYVEKSIKEGKLRDANIHNLFSPEVAMKWYDELDAPYLEIFREQIEKSERELAELCARGLDENSLSDKGTPKIKTDMEEEMLLGQHVKTVE